MFPANPSRLLANMHSTLASLDPTDNRKRHGMGAEQHINPDLSISEEPGKEFRPNTTSLPAHTPPLSITVPQASKDAGIDTEDARIDRIRQLLARTDWNQEVKSSFLLFTMRMVNFSRASDSQVDDSQISDSRVSEMYSLRNDLKMPRQKIASDAEQQTLEYLDRAIFDLATIVDFTSSHLEAQESKRDEIINRTRDDLEQAQLASGKVGKKPNQDALLFMCTLLVDHIDTMIPQLDDTASESSE